MKKNGLRYLVAVFMLILSAQVWGQNSAITVSGKVSDSKGEPLSGITVIVEGTRKGTSTNS